MEIKLGKTALEGSEQITVSLEEYKSLRAESLQSISNRNSILTLGLATLGLIFGAGVVSLHQQNLLAFLIFTLIIPVLSLIILVLWMGEVQRMVRVGNYLVDFENSINRLFGETAKLLQWENWLREIQTDKKTPQLLYPYSAVIALFLGVAILAPIMYLIVSGFLISPKRLILISLVYVLIIAVFLWTIIKKREM